MGTAYGIAKSHNAEVVSRYFVIALLARDETAYEPAARLLGQFGRMKFVRPMYVLPLPTRLSSRQGRRLRHNFQLLTVAVAFAPSIRSIDRSLSRPLKPTRISIIRSVELWSRRTSLGVKTGSDRAWHQRGPREEYGGCFAPSPRAAGRGSRLISDILRTRIGLKGERVIANPTQDKKRIGNAIEKVKKRRGASDRSYTGERFRNSGRGVVGSWYDFEGVVTE